MKSRSGYRYIGQIAACMFAVCGVGGAWGQVISLQINSPTMDRWNYPFDSAPGYSETAAVFSAIGQEDAFPPFSFDQRDAQMIVGWDLNGQVPPGLGGCRYRVLSAVMTITTLGDPSFRYDPTSDPRSSYLAGGVDADPGRPIELFGVGFRNGWTLGAPGQAGCPVPPMLPGFPCWYEGSVDLPGPPQGPCICKDQRNAFATDFAGSVARDISNNVRDGFEAKAFAVGQIAGVVPGAYVPVNSPVVFSLDVADVDVQAYLRVALDAGRLMLSVSSLQPATSAGGPGAGEYARFYCKEHPLGSVPGGGPYRWASLSISVRVISLAGDVNYDGVVNTADLALLLLQFGRSGVLDSDLNCDGVVNTGDLALLLLNFGRTG